jgi:hypothetical protein
MTQLYKIPTNIVSPGFIKSMIGIEGTVPNPVQDVNGDWFISIEEWDSPEFQMYKDSWPTEIADFVLEDFVPPEYPTE